MQSTTFLEAIKDVRIIYYISELMIPCNCEVIIRKLSFIFHVDHLAVYDMTLDSPETNKK